MKQPYQRYHIAPSPLNPSGFVYEPRVPLVVIGPNGITQWAALVDTGANHCVLPATDAEVLGISLDDADQVVASGFAGDELPISLATVDLHVSHDGQSFQWSAIVGFAPFKQPEDELAILGHIGCLDYFRATFDGDAHELDLVPTPQFPGTVRRIAAT